MALAGILHVLRSMRKLLSLLANLVSGRKPTVSEAVDAVSDTVAKPPAVMLSGTARPTKSVTVAPVVGNLTTDRNDPRLSQVRPDGQNEVYFVLSEEERAKGFVEPVRRAYRHVGLAGGKPGCGTVTTMGLALCETYARNPKQYHSTFCCGCGSHIAVAEFVWEGTSPEVRVGSRSTEAQ